MAIETTNILDSLATVFGGPVGIAFSLTLLGALTLGGLRQHKLHQKSGSPAQDDASKIPRELKFAARYD